MRTAGSVAKSLQRVLTDRERRGMLSATPERIAKLSEPFRSITTTDEDGVVVETQFFSASVLERLFNSRVLGKGREEAQARLDAGERLYAHWYHGRMLPLGSRDYRVPYTGRHDGFALMPASERAEFHRRSWRDADNHLGGDRIAIVTRAIVIEDKEPTAVGIVVSGRHDKAQARAVAVEYLVDGLDRLRKLWA